MPSCQCEGLERETATWVDEDLALYKRGKPANTTRMLIDTLLDLGVQGRSLLDVGGGIGLIQIELLGAGARAAISVEASAAYLRAAAEEARRAGVQDRITYLHGDFVQLAASTRDADIVTLDRVICCYDDVRRLVSLSASKARKLYAAVYPRSTWWVRVPLFFENLGYRLRGSPFRAFVHPTELVDQLIREAGFSQAFRRQTFMWQVVVYQRQNAGA